MIQKQYDILLKVPFNQIADCFVKKYYEFYGTAKMEHIFFELEHRAKIEDYIGSRTAGAPPTAADIFKLVKSVPYFFFDKAGARCVAALNILLLWHDRYNSKNDILSGNDLTRLCAEIVGVTFGKSLLGDKKVLDGFFREIAASADSLAGLPVA